MYQNVKHLSLMIFKGKLSTLRKNQIFLPHWPTNVMMLNHFDGPLNYLWLGLDHTLWAWSQKPREEMV